MLLDIMLPEIGGYELLDYIKMNDTPEIFITAMGELQDRVRGLRVGADDYITKLYPYSPDLQPVCELYPAGFFSQCL